MQETFWEKKNPKPAATEQNPTHTTKQKGKSEIFLGFFNLFV